MTQVLQRLPRQLLRGGWISGLLEETRLRLLKKGLYGSSELRISEVAGKSGRASRTAGSWRVISRRWFAVVCPPVDTRQ